MKNYLVLILTLFAFTAQSQVSVYTSPPPTNNSPLNKRIGVSEKNGNIVSQKSIRLDSLPLSDSAKAAITNGLAEKANSTTVLNKSDSSLYETKGAHQKTLDSLIANGESFDPTLYAPIIAPNLTGNARVNGDSIATKAYARSVGGTGTSGTIPELTGNPTTGNIYLNSGDNRIYYKIGSLWYKAAAGEAVTSVVNLFSFPNELDNSYWNKFGLAVTPNAIAAPSGATIAEGFTATSTTSAQKYLQKTPAITTAGPYCLSFDVKAGAVNSVMIWLQGGGKWSSVYVDLTTGTTIDNGWGDEKQNGAINLGNGWWRVWTSHNFAATGMDAFLSPATGGVGTEVYSAGNTTSVQLYVTNALLKAGHTTID